MGHFTSRILLVSCRQCLLRQWGQEGVKPLAAIHRQEGWMNPGLSPGQLPLGLHTASLQPPSPHWDAPWPGPITLGLLKQLKRFQKRVFFCFSLLDTTYHLLGMSPEAMIREKSVCPCDRASPLHWVYSKETQWGRHVIIRACWCEALPSKAGVFTGPQSDTIILRVLDNGFSFLL